MAHSSPSPSSDTSSSRSSRRRRLSEVLGEKQEPFSLDLYLLERGCSPAFLDATASACGGGSCGSTCWPKTRGTVWTLRRPAMDKKGSRRSNGVLRMLLSKILSGTTAAPPAATRRKKKQPAAIGWHRGVAEKQSTPDTDRFSLALRSASPRAVEARMEDDDDDGEQEQDQEDEEDESSSKKQLSPVSVLEQRLFDYSSPPPPHAPKAMAIFGELLEAAYAPNTLLNDVLAMVAKDRSSSTESKDDRCRSSSSTDSSSTPTTPRARRRRKKRKKQAHRKEEEHVNVPLEEDLVRLTSLVAPEMAGARVRAEDLRPAVEDVGGAIAAAVLDALTEETAAELIMIMMGMDHGLSTRGPAVDVTRWCGRR